MINKVTSLGFDKPFTPKPDNEYERAARDFLDRHGIRMTMDLGDGECSLWCDGGERIEASTGGRLSSQVHNHGDHYRVTMKKRGSVSWTFDFWGSIHDQRHGFTPTEYDVLTSITKDDPGTFEVFCSDMGYSEDSRKAEGMHKAVTKEWKKVRRFFTDAELEELRTIQ